MSDYLQRLEQLGDLLKKGVLTQDEFDREKGRILRGGDDFAAVPQPVEPIQAYRDTGVARRRNIRIALFGGTIVVIIAAVAAWQSFSASRASSPTSSVTSESASSEVLPTSIDLTDPARCIPNRPLENLIDRMKTAGADDTREERLVFLENVRDPIEVQTTRIESPAGPTTLTRLPVSIRWHGLEVVGLRAVEFGNGTGFGIEFADSSTAVKKVLSDIGIKDFAKQSTAPEGAIIGFDDVGRYRTLTCMRSNSGATDTAKLGEGSGSE